METPTLPLTPPIARVPWGTSDAPEANSVLDGPLQDASAEPFFTEAMLPKVLPEILTARQKTLVLENRALLWDPTVRDDKNLGAVCIGFEGGQYGKSHTLPQLLKFASRISADVVQPCGGHIDLARCADDFGYCSWVKAHFAAAKQPLISVSIHLDTYAALAAAADPRARMFSPADCARDTPTKSQNAHLSKLAKMIVGAAQLGIRRLHLFWGCPAALPVYGWPPFGTDEVKDARKEFVRLVKPLIALAASLGIRLCHEIHYGTVAMNADDFIEVWEMLGRPENFQVGMDTSHFWHGEGWVIAMDKLRKAGVKIGLAHAKNMYVVDGRPTLGNQPDDRLRGMFFCSLEDPRGLVSFDVYAGMLCLPGVGMVESFHGEEQLPIPILVEAENPFWEIAQVTENGIAYLKVLLGGKHLPKEHFTANMKNS